MFTSCLQFTNIYIGICLYVVNVFAGKSQLTAATLGRTDNTSCYSVTQSERAAHGNNPFSRS